MISKCLYDAAQVASSDIRVKHYHVQWRTVA